MMDEARGSFSPLNLNCGQLNSNKKRLPRRELKSSLVVGWTSLLVQTFEASYNLESFETSPTPDLSLVLVTREICEVESFSGGKWKKVTTCSGDSGMTAGGKTDRLRLKTPNFEVVQTVHIYIPPHYFAAAAEEYRRAGTGSRFEQPDTLGFTNPVVAHTASACRLKKIKPLLIYGLKEHATS